VPFRESRTLDYCHIFLPLPFFRRLNLRRYLEWHRHSVPGIDEGHSGGVGTPSMINGYSIIYKIVNNLFWRYSPGKLSNRRDAATLA
jgi:hypothetical protein